MCDVKAQAMHQQIIQDATTITTLRAEVERLCAALLGEETEHSRCILACDLLRAEVERLKTSSRIAFAEADNCHSQIDALVAEIQMWKDISETNTTLRAEVEKLRKAVKLWRDAYETHRNEPLVIAYEATAALAEEKRG